MICQYNINDNGNAFKDFMILCIIPIHRKVNRNCLHSFTNIGFVYNCVIDIYANFKTRNLDKIIFHRIDALE